MIKELAINISGRPIKKHCRLGLGVFDGFHLGHKKLADRCDALLTFSPHPSYILSKKKTFKMLSTLRERRKLYSNLYVLGFSKVIANLTPDQFLDDIIWEYFQPKSIVVGYDFRFGSGGMGNSQFIKTWALKRNIEFQEVPAFSIDSQIVKSSLVRDSLLKGQFDKAITLMGHPYLISGKVIQGDGQGKRLGFPTANLQLPTYKLIPKEGVYIGSLTLVGKTYMSLVSIGFKPTFDGDALHVEAYIEGFDGDLYGKYITIYLQKFLRNQLKFQSKKELISQLEIDRLTIKL